MKRRIASAAFAALAFCAALPATTLAADPVLRQGLWEYKRWVPGAGGKAVEMASKKCADPAASFKSMSEMVTKQGCKLTASLVKGNVRTTTTECPVQGGIVTSENVMTITNDSAYTVDITTTHGGKTSKQTLAAKRVGDC